MARRRRVGHLLDAPPLGGAPPPEPRALPLLGRRRRTSARPGRALAWSASPVAEASPRAAPLLGRTPPEQPRRSRAIASSASAIGGALAPPPAWLCRQRMTAPRVPRRGRLASPRPVDQVVAIDWPSALLGSLKGLPRRRGRWLWSASATAIATAPGDLWQALAAWYDTHPNLHVSGGLHLDTAPSDAELPYAVVIDVAGVSSGDSEDAHRLEFQTLQISLFAPSRTAAGALRSAWSTGPDGLDAAELSVTDGQLLSLLRTDKRMRRSGTRDRDGDDVWIADLDYTALLSEGS